MNNAENERGVPRLVINYTPLNKVLKWIRYPLPNKRDLLNRTVNAQIFSNIDLKFSYWQIQVAEQDRYKTAFTVPFGHYEWNVMPFGLKNAPSEFQHITNDIFVPYSQYILSYIDDILIFSNTLDEHFKHLNVFQHVVTKNRLVVSAPKMKFFQTKVRFLGHLIVNNTITHIQRSIEFVSKLPDEITDTKQLQRFLGTLNYVADYYQNLAFDIKILYSMITKKSITLDRRTYYYYSPNKS